MELKDIQEQVVNKFLSNLERDKISATDDYFLLKITEEIGELVQSYIIHKKQCRPEKFVSEEESKREMAKELADVVGLAFVLANKHDIDLEEALLKKWITREWIKKK